MNRFMKDCLIIGLESKGFDLDFEAKSDIDGGFECNILSDRQQIFMIVGENALARTKDGKENMVYRHYCCQIGDDAYLKGFLESEILIRNSNLLTGEYFGLFLELIDKVKSYGTKNAELLIRPLMNAGSTGHRDMVNPYAKGENVIELSKYRRSRHQSRLGIPHERDRSQRPCHMI